MNSNKTNKIFFVDDEPKVLKAVSQTLSDAGLDVRCFDSAIDCLSELKTAECNLLITDVNMDGMNGVQLLKEVRKTRPQLPVLVVTGFGDVPLAVLAVKSGAHDFIEKPLDADTFVPIVMEALDQPDYEEGLSGKPLTNAEKTIVRMIADGKSNKEIAHILCRSVRTVENHRHRIMKKLGIDSTAELVKMAIQMGLTQPSI